MNALRMLRRRAREQIQAWGVRSRVTIAAGSMLAVIFTIGAVALVGLVRQSLIVNLDAGATTRASDIAARISTGPIPATLPAQADDSNLIQIVDSANSVVSASANIVGEPPIFPTPPRTHAATTLDVANIPVGIPSAQYRVTAHPVTLNGDAGWLYIATSLNQVDAATNSLTWLLVAGLPTLVALVGVAVWIAAGRALRPIEDIRRLAVSIDGELSQRVPVPPSHDEVSRLAVSMNQMLDRLQAAAHKQRRFTGDASHELRSPLATLRAQVEIALTEPDAVDALDTLARVNSQAVRMSEIIEDLLFLARADEGEHRRSLEHVDLDELIISEFRRLEAIGRAGVRLVRLDGVATTGSPRDLARMLRNIGDNALRHARSGVWLALRADENNAVVTITNDGPPIPIADRQRIFDRFIRLDDARSRRRGESGSGLGLAIAAEIAAAHGGHIVVTSLATSLRDAEDRTAFVITLPLASTQ